MPAFQKHERPFGQMSVVVFQPHTFASESDKEGRARIWANVEWERQAPATSFVSFTGELRNDLGGGSVVVGQAKLSIY